MNQEVKGAKGSQTLLFALAMSLPALFNICLLLFLVMFIFAIFGMSFFLHVKDKSGLDDVYNFKTFGQSMILLFQMSTSAGWDGVLDGLINEEDCKQPDNEIGETGNCGKSTNEIAFLLSYLVISFLIAINMYIAVTLENYSQATQDVQQGLTDDDYDMYDEFEQQFDPDGTQYILYDQQSDFLDVLEPSLPIHKPKKYKKISMVIPTCKGNAFETKRRRQDSSKVHDESTEDFAELLINQEVKMMKLVMQKEMFMNLEPIRHGFWWK